MDSFHKDVFNDLPEAGALKDVCFTEYRQLMLNTVVNTKEPPERSLQPARAQEQNSPHSASSSQIFAISPEVAARNNLQKDEFCFIAGDKCVPVPRAIVKRSQCLTKFMSFTPANHAYGLDTNGMAFALYIKWLELDKPPIFRFITERDREATENEWTWSEGARFVDAYALGAQLHEPEFQDYIKRESRRKKMPMPLSPVGVKQPLTVGEPIEEKGRAVPLQTRSDAGKPTQVESDAPEPPTPKYRFSLRMIPSKVGRRLSIAKKFDALVANEAPRDVDTNKRLPALPEASRAQQPRRAPRTPLQSPRPLVQAPRVASAPPTHPALRELQERTLSVSMPPRFPHSPPSVQEQESSSVYSSQISPPSSLLAISEEPAVRWEPAVQEEPTMDDQFLEDYLQAPVHQDEHWALPASPLPSPRFHNEPAIPEMPRATYMPFAPREAFNQPTMRAWNPSSLSPRPVSFSQLSPASLSSSGMPATTGERSIPAWLAMTEEPARPEVLETQVPATQEEPTWRSFTPLVQILDSLLQPADRPPIPPRHPARLAIPTQDLIPHPLSFKVPSSPPRIHPNTYSEAESSPPEPQAQPLPSGLSPYAAAPNYPPNPPEPQTPIPTHPSTIYPTYIATSSDDTTPSPQTPISGSSDYEIDHIGSRCSSPVLPTAGYTYDTPSNSPPSSLIGSWSPVRKLVPLNRPPPPPPFARASTPPQLSSSSFSALGAMHLDGGRSPPRSQAQPQPGGDPTLQYKAQKLKDFSCIGVETPRERKKRRRAQRRADRA